MTIRRMIRTFALLMLFGNAFDLAPFATSQLSPFDPLVFVEPAPTDFCTTDVGGTTTCVFLESASWIPPLGIASFRITIWGGGGGGAFSVQMTSPTAFDLVYAGGGSGSALIAMPYNLTKDWFGAPWNIQVGSGGTGSAFTQSDVVSMIDYAQQQQLPFTIKTGGDGGASSIQIAGETIAKAFGGGGALASSAFEAIPGAGGGSGSSAIGATPGSACSFPFFGCPSSTKGPMGATGSGNSGETSSNGFWHAGGSGGTTTQPGALWNGTNVKSLYSTPDKNSGKDAQPFVPSVFHSSSPLSQGYGSGANGFGGYAAQPDACPPMGSCDSPFGSGSGGLGNMIYSKTQLAFYLTVGAASLSGSSGFIQDAFSVIPAGNGGSGGVIIQFSLSSNDNENHHQPTTTTNSTLAMVSPSPSFALDSFCSCKADRQSGIEGNM